MHKVPGFWIEFARNAEGGGSGAGAADANSGGNGGGQGGGAGDSGTTTAFDWAGSLGERHSEFVETLTAKGWKSPADALAAYTQLEKDSAGRVAIPGDGASDEERAAFWKAIGRPDTVEGYGLTRPENMPEAEWDDERMGRFAAAAHALGMPAAHVKGVIDWLAKDTAEQIAAFEADLPNRQKAHQDNLTAALQKEFGAKADQQRDLAARAFRTYVTDEQAEAGINALSATVGDINVIKMFAKIGADIGESSLKGGGGSSFGAMTPEAAKAELAIKEKDEKWIAAVFDRDNPQHAAALAEWQRLKLLAAGEAVS